MVCGCCGRGVNYRDGAMLDGFRGMGILVQGRFERFFISRGGGRLVMEMCL